MTMFSPVSTETRYSTRGSRPMPMFVTSQIVDPPARRNFRASSTAIPASICTRLSR